jgi:hypothetical protein
MGVNTMKPWEKYTRQSLQPMTEEQRLSALDLAKQIRPQTDNTFGDYLAQNVADAVYGADRAISGATLGGYDWLKRKTGLGLNQDDYLAMKKYNEGSALPAQVAGFTSEVGGNILGGGGAIAKGLMNKGLTGLPLLMASGGLESAVYGATGSDTLGDLPKNVAISGSLGTVMPVAFKGIGAGVKKLASPFIPSMATKGLKGGLENVVENPDSIRLLNRGIKSSDDVANEVLLQSRPVARDINKQSANMIDEALTSRIDVPEAIRNANARYGKYMDEHGADQIYSMLSPEKQAKANFDRWYEGSKLFDSEGNPLKLYHGTRANFDAFDINKAGQSNGNVSKIGFWLTPEEQIAKDFSEGWYGGETPKVLSTYVNFKNPKVYKNVDNTKALKKVENSMKDIKDNMQKIIKDYSYGNMNQLRYYTNSDDFYDIAKMRGYSREEADAARQYWNYDKQLDDLLFEQRMLKANDSYDQLMNDLDEYSKFIQHVDGVKDFKRGSHISDLAITNQDEAVSKLKEKLKKEGYDSIIVENTNRDTQNVGRNVSQYIAFEPNQIKSVNNSGAWSNSPSLSDAGWKPDPYIGSLYDGLTPFQSNRLDNAIKTGFSKTNAKQGSLESMNKVKQEINEQIKKAQVTDKPSEVLQLQDLKKKFDSSMPEGLKAVDKGYEKAKRLESAFDRGTHYNPNNVEGADYISELSPLEKNAFTQGLFKRINNNSLANKNLAKTAMDYDNTLADVLSSDKYNELTRNLNKQSVMFDRLAGLGRKAESKLNTPEAQRFFGREQLESKGSLLGSALDLLDSNLRRRYYTNAGKNLLNPNYNGELSAMGKVFNSADALANYLSTQNPLLGSGLSATALRNLTNGND